MAKRIEDMNFQIFLSMGIAYDAESDKIKHYRVDKMRKISITDKKRQGKELFKAFDLATYTKKNFGMFGGEEIKIKLRFENDMVGVIIDRFGKDITIRESAKEGWSETNVDVALSDQFFGWIFGVGNKVLIVGPQEAADRYKKELAERLSLMNSI